MISIYEARRLVYPRLRRSGVTGIIRNGSRMRVYSCCVCGAQHSMCTMWPMPKHMGEWIIKHEHNCGSEICIIAEQQLTERVVQS